MKKFALALGLVLALSVSAMAAVNLSISGTLTFEGDYYSQAYTDNPTWSSTQYTYTDGHPIWAKAPELKMTLSASGDNYNVSMGATVSNKIYNTWVGSRKTTFTAGDPGVFTVPSWTRSNTNSEDNAIAIYLYNCYVKGSGVLGLPGTWTLGQKYNDSDSTYTKAIWYTNTFGAITANGQYNFDPTKGWSADATLKLSDTTSIKGSYALSQGKLLSGAAPDDSSTIEATYTFGKASIKGTVFSTPVASDLSSKAGSYYAATVSALPIGPIVVDAYAKYWSDDFSYCDKLGVSGGGYMTDPWYVDAGLANEASYVKATYNLSADGASNVYGKYWLDSDYEVSATLASVAGFKLVGTYGSYTQDSSDTVADLEEALREAYPDIDLGSDYTYGSVMSKWSVSAEKAFNNVTYKAAYDQTGKVAVTAVYKF